MALLYCCINGSRDVQLVDTAAGTVIKTITMGAGFQPVMGAVSPDGNWVAVLGKSGSSTNLLQYIYCGTNTPVGSPTNMGDNGGGLAWSNNSGIVYVNCQTSMRSFDLSGVLQSSVPTPHTWGTGGAMAATSTHTMFYCAVGDQFSCAVASFNPATNSWGTSWSAPYASGNAYTADVAINGSDDLLYVAGYDIDKTPNVHLYVVTTGGTWGSATPLALSGLGTYQMPTLAYAPAGELYVAGFAGTVYVADAAAATLVATLTGFANSHRPRLLRNGTQMWVANYFQNSHNSIQPVNTTSHTVGAGINAESGVTAIIEAISIANILVGPITVAATGSPLGARLALGPLAVTASGMSTSPPPPVGTASVTVGPVTLHATLPITTHAAVAVGPVELFSLGGRLGPRAWPVPGYRGQWRLTLHARTFAPATLMSTLIAEITDARGRQLVQAWNQPAQCTFTLDGQSDSAALINELEQDVALWRWDDQTGQDFVLFRGPVTQSEDQLDEQSHTVTYTAHDYAAMLQRRLITFDGATTYTAQDQDAIVGDLLNTAKNAHSSSGSPFSPASYFPLSFVAVGPSGALRGLSGRHRNRTYYGSQNIGTAIDDLAKVIEGYDYDVQPNATDSTDSLRVFFPQQGVTRTDYILQYGGNVSTVTRTVDSSEYANYVRVLGNSGGTDPAAQLWGENWMYDAAHIDDNPVGTWMADENASDVTVQDTLDDKATGDVILMSNLQPHYTLGLAPDTYEYGSPNMGDTVPLIIQSGRLNVSTTVRVLGITYDIGDDGQEDVSLVVNRPQSTLAKLFHQTDQSIKALDRR